MIYLADNDISVPPQTISALAVLPVIEPPAEDKKTCEPLASRHVATVGMQIHILSHIAGDELVDDL